MALNEEEKNSVYAIELDAHHRRCEKYVIGIAAKLHLKRRAKINAR